MVNNPCVASRFPFPHRCAMRTKVDATSAWARVPAEVDTTPSAQLASAGQK